MRKLLKILPLFLMPFIFGANDSGLQEVVEKDGDQTIRYFINLEYNDFSADCCKHCCKGCACGDSCISCDKSCNAGPGCACAGCGFAGCDGCG